MHIFPEGKVNSKHETMRLKWGVGRLVYDCYNSCDYLQPQESSLSQNEGVTSYTRALNRTLGDAVSAVGHAARSLFLSASSSSSSSLSAVAQSTQEEIAPATGEDLKKFPGKAPVILIVYHLGLDSVLPNRKPFIPLVGKKVTIAVGEPLDSGPLLAQLSHERADRQEAMKRITDWIEEEFNRMKMKTKELHGISQS